MKRFIFTLITIIITCCVATAVVKDFDEIQRKAENGNAEAQFQLGRIYHNGDGIEPNFNKAVYWYKKAAQQGYVDAQINLGSCYDENEDFDSAFYWNMEAAKQGSPIGQTNVGYYYRSGDGVAKDYAKAAYWFQKAADQGDAVGEQALGACYLKGDGVLQDYAKGIEWTKKAAQQGDTVAAYNLGVYYYNGDEIPKDYSQAFHWLQLSAQHGCSLALNFINKYSDIFMPIYDKEHANDKDDDDNDETASTAATAAVETPTSLNVDDKIPQSTVNNDKTFAVIIANENYKHEQPVEYANNDGTVFSEYCNKTLGIPQNNIHLVKDASFTDIHHELNWLKGIANAYKGKEKLIVYYAGHGVPDEHNAASYLIPADGYSNDTVTCCKLADIYNDLGVMPAKMVTVILDACFSGSERSGKMLNSSRGVAIHAHKDIPTGNVIVFSAAQGDETAYPLNEQNHGLFTYFLLKELKLTKGDATLGDIINNVTSNVSQQSIIVNKKSQTPTASISPSIADTWKSLTFK